MPIIKSAKKAARQAVKRRDSNQAIKKVIRGALKEFRANPNAENMKKVQSEYDKAVKKGLMKKNTASRRKANLVKIAKAANVKVEAKAAKPAAAKKEAAPKAEKLAAKATKATKPAAKKAPAKKAAAKKEA